MAPQKGIVVELPKEVVENCNGLAFDYGGSALKVAYIDKQDQEEYKNTKQITNTAKIRLLIYARGELEEALTFIKEHCSIARDGNPKPTIYTTGVGCYQSAAIIEDTLNIKIHNLWEADCFIKAFVYLTKRWSPLQMEYTPSDEHRQRLTEVKRGIRQNLMMWDTPSATGESMLRPRKEIDWTAFNVEREPGARDLPMSEAFSDLYPCLMFGLCSVHWCRRIHSDGSYEEIDGLFPGGRTFLGLGQLLLGRETNYDELIDLAEQGDNFQVDETIQDVVGTDIADGVPDVYSRMAQTEGMVREPLFMFGQAANINPEQFRKEDIIRCLLLTTVREVVGLLFQSILLTSVTHVFAMGSFFNRELVRELFAFEFERRKVNMAAAYDGKGLTAQLHIIKNGSHLGAYGALIHSTEPVFTATNNTDTA